MFMKKAILLFLALFPAMVSWSQDTVGQIDTSNFFLSHLPGFKEGTYFEWFRNSGDKCGKQAKEMYVGDKDSLTIYGIAAIMLTRKDAFYIPPTADSAERWDFFFQTYGDTLTESLFEYLGVYLRDADSLVPHREVMIHRKYDTPAYYYETGLNGFGNPNLVCPMYEKYFDSAITVFDTFYIGTTMLTAERHIGPPDNMFFSVVVIYEEGSTAQEYHPFKYCTPNYNSWRWPLPMENDHRFYMMFPIITPAPEPGDTTAVGAAEMVSRYVTVRPNPAKEEARVLSSFGMTRIEVYNNEGRRVLDRSATGMEATIDVKAWPAGTYLLRVTTPLGTTTKKLLVR